MAIKIRILIGKESVVVGLRVKIRVSGVVKSDPSFLLLSPSDVLDWISAPHLSFLHHSPRRNHAVWCNNSSLLQDRTLQDDRVMPNINTFLYRTRVKSAIVLNDIISLNQQFRP